MVTRRSDRPGAQEWVPTGARSVTALHEAAASCRGCELYRDATQVVFSTGSRSAAMALVGEQPGDVEDRRGEPFVGPAGRLLDQALEAAGVDRDQVYLTNAVKHFRFKTEAPKKRRIHQSPDLAHLTACRPWLDAELALVRPQVVVCLGASAARSLLGKDFRLTARRGEAIPGEVGGRAVTFLATAHPSAVLRARDDRDAALAGLVADLETARALA
jgi:DNA polymerase